MIRLYLLDVSPTERVARFSVEPRGGVVSVPLSRDQIGALVPMVGRRFEIAEEVAPVAAAEVVNA